MLCLIDPDPSGFKNIALAEGKLLIRDQSHMLCLKVAD